MKDNYIRFGRLTVELLYLLQCVILVWYVADTHRYNEYTNLVIYFFCVFSTVCIWTMGRLGNVAPMLYCSTIALASLVLAMIQLLICEKLIFMILVYMLQWLLIIPFLKRRVCLSLAVVQFLGIGMVYMLTRQGVFDFLNRDDIMALSLSLVIALWVSYGIIGLIKEHIRRDIEQSQSNEDMLKLVEAMCEEARSATRSKSDFLSNMSHEIRTPINSVLGMNEMILRETEDQNIREYASNIDNSGHMLLGIINDILDFSKIESGKMELVNTGYRLSSMLRDFDNMLRARAESKGLKFVIEADENMQEYLIGDEVRVKQIVTNLLTNAIKYTEEGSVTLTVSQEGYQDGNVELSFAVADTGQGIRDDDREKLFAAFRRIDEKKNRNIEGTGLGLAISANFVKMMNGVIRVDSEYGKGSVFTVTIPQKVEKEGRMADVVTLSEGTAQQPEVAQAAFTAPEAQILVVDDTEMNLKVVRGLLKRTQAKVTTLPSGAAALNFLRRKSADLILLDHMMPEMDGIETLKAIKNERLTDAPCIALTANAVAGSRKMYLSAGFNDYLSKPMTGAQLEEMLLRYLPEDKICR